MSDGHVISVGDPEDSGVAENVHELHIAESHLDGILVVQTINNPDNNEEISEEIEIELPIEFEKLISIDTSQIAKVCRTCLSEKSDMHSLFETWDVDTLAEMLATFASVQLTFGDGLPESLCQDCVELVGKCYAFKQLCERSESMLRLLMNQGHLQLQGLKDSNSETDTEAQHRSVIIKTSDKNEDYRSVEISKEDIQDRRSEVEDTNYQEPLYEDNEREPYKVTSKYMKMANLSITSNPCIAIKPSVDIKPEKRKKTKSINGLHKVKKCKIKRLQEVQEPTDCLAVDNLNDDVEIKLETEEDSDRSLDINDTSMDYAEEEIRFQCSLCGKEFPSQKKLSRHEKTHLSIKPFKCDICGKGFNESGDLRRHERIHKRKEEINNGLQLIEDDKSLLEIRVPCTQCHLTFGSESDLAIHQAIHIEFNGKKICHHCKKQFDTTLQLKRHVRTHLSDKPYKCRICYKGFPEMGSLTRHFRRHTGETREKKHVCKHCDKAYHDRHSLNIHMRKHTGERPWICSDCGKGFIDSRLLNSHMKVHSDNKPFACTMCDKRFKHESTLTTHVRIHTGEKPYICTVCGNAFVQSSNLSLHMRSHTRERPYPCDRCPKKFSSSSALTTHRRIHTGEKPFSCNICQKKFARHDMSAHMRRHTGEKPHECSVCSKRFTTLGQLNLHTRIHTGEKPFTCQICNKSCATSSYLKKHMLRAHNTTCIWQLPEDVIKQGILDIPAEDKFKETSTDKTIAIPKNDNKLNKPHIVKNEIIPVEQAADNAASTLTTYSSNMLNVVAVAAANGEVSILSQKNDLNISTLRAQTGDNISTIVSNTEEKLYQIDPSLLRIHHITSLQAGHITIADLGGDNQQ